MIQFTVYVAGVTLLVTAISIVALWLLRLYKWRAFLVIVPIAVAITLAPFGAKNSSNWREVIESDAPPIVLSPIFVWMFFRNRRKPTL